MNLHGQLYKFISLPVGYILILDEDEIEMETIIMSSTVCSLKEFNTFVKFMKNHGELVIYNIELINDTEFILRFGICTKEIFVPMNIDNLEFEILSN